MQQTDPAAQVEKVIRDVAGQADLIGWNELSTPAAREVARTLPGFQTYLPSGAAGSVAVTWRVDVFDFVSASTTLVHGGVKNVTPSRYVNRVLLRHRATGRLVARLNTHVVHHIDVGGRARTVDTIPGQNERARHHFAMLRDAIIEARIDVAADTGNGVVVVGGDFNVDYLAELRRTEATRTPWFPLTVLSSVATPVMPDRGTLGRRAIDWTLVAGTVTPVKVTVLPAGTSDHNPVSTLLELA